MAIVCIAISFFIVILSVSVSSGFRKELRSAISTISGDIRLSGADLNYLDEGSPIKLSSKCLTVLPTIQGISEIKPMVYRAGIVSSGDDIAGVVFKGVEGSFDSLKVSIPSRLSSVLGLKVGDDFTAYFIGEKVKARKFHVGSIYPGVLSTSENFLVYAGIDDLRRLNMWSSDDASAIEIILDDKSQMREISEEIGTRMLLASSPDEEIPVTQTAANLYPNIFSWLELIDTNVLVILILMTIVAGFNMISGLLILLFRNISTIGILKAMGMTNGGISRVFLRAGSNLVIKGLIIGNVLALIFCLIQGHFHLIHLDPDNYFLSFVPVHINLTLILLSDLVSYGAIMLMLLAPSLYVSKIDPATTVKVE